MKLLNGIMWTGIGLAILKVIIVLIILYVKNKEFNKAWSKWDKKLWLWVTNSFVLEVIIAVATKLIISQLFLIDITLANLFIGFLTTSISLGFITIWFYTLRKIMIKFIFNNS